MSLKNPTIIADEPDGPAAARAAWAVFALSVTSMALDDRGRRLICAGANGVVRIDALDGQ